MRKKATMFAVLALIAGGVFATTTASAGAHTGAYEQS